MDGIWCYVLFALGLLLIIKASDYFVDGAIWVARISRIPEVIIGATLVSLCTTLPETVISAMSSAHGMPEMAFGNAFGSIACNTAFILALPLLIARPDIHNRRSIVRNLVVLVALLLLMGFSLLHTGGQISRLMGLLLLALLVVYLVGNVKSAKREPHASAHTALETGARAWLKNGLSLGLGAVGVILGSNLLVHNGELIARSLGVSELLIGLTITALGSSLPELITAITAMRKRAHSLSVGNIIGADILNILLVTGLATVISPIGIDLASAIFTIAFDFVVVMALLTFTLTNQYRYRRTDGLFLLLLYAGYLAVNLLFFAQ